MKAILFPGQGAQKVGMGKDLVDSHPAAKAVFEEADAVLGYSLSKLCFEGPAEDLTKTDRAQPAIYTTSVAAVLAAEATGEFNRKDFGAFAGLSLGEYTALWCAEVFSFADGLKLVQRRGSAMQEASDLQPSGMVSLVGVDRAKAEELCDAAREDGILVVANLNAPGQVVISGSKDACERAAAAAKGMGIRRAIPLQVAGAFHSPVMEPARASLEQALTDTQLSDPQVPVYSNVTAAKVASASEVKELLAQQVVAPVRWEDSMRAMIEAGLVGAVEPPPGNVLKGIMKKINPEIVVEALLG